MPRPIHFETHADNSPRAVKFYESLLGWQFTKWEGPMEYWLIKTGSEGSPGIDGGLVKRMGAAPTEGAALNAYVCTADTDSVDQTIEKLMSWGGKLTLPKMAVPGVGRLAYGKDTEGNILGFMQADPLAQSEV
ncbi:MAG TPA: VOC family protein [Gemmatimonadales bacterium]|nr:VOC family protein [Gemmatimonadales bacterium]